jgi:valyl-tRNA synthetase
MDETAEAEMETLMALVRAIRNLRAEYNVTPGKRIPARIAGDELTSVLQAQRGVLSSLAKLDAGDIQIEEAVEAPERTATVVVGDVAGYLPLAGRVDLAAERERLAKELEEVAGRIEGSQDLLASEFAEKAPPHIVQRERDKLADLETTQSQLRERLERLSE